MGYITECRDEVETVSDIDSFLQLFIIQSIDHFSLNSTRLLFFAYWVLGSGGHRKKFFQWRESMVINTQDTNYTFGGMGIKLNYSFKGMIFNTQDTNYSIVGGMGMNT